MQKKERNETAEVYISSHHTSKKIKKRKINNQMMGEKVQNIFIYLLFIAIMYE